MGSWAAGLYDDDEALDLKSAIAVVTKMPISADQMLQILQENSLSGTMLEEEGGPAFWLVVADQFATKGIACDRAFELAKRIIEDDLDIKHKTALGADRTYIKARRKVLSKLLERIRLPVKARELKTQKTKPRQAVQAGEVYVYPTMKDQNSVTWVGGRVDSGFVPDGHGALLIVATGTVYDWFPWCAYSPLSIDPDQATTLADVLKAKLTFRDGAAYCVAKPSHMRDLKMELLCSLVLNPESADNAINKGWKKPIDAVINEYSFANGAFSTRDKSVGFIPVQDLISHDR